MPTAAPTLIHQALAVLPLHPVGDGGHKRGLAGHCVLLGPCDHVEHLQDVVVDLAKDQHYSMWAVLGFMDLMVEGDMRS